MTPATLNVASRRDWTAPVFPPLAGFRDAIVANPGLGDSVLFRCSHLFPDGKMVFESLFRSTKVQPSACH